MSQHPYGWFSLLPPVAAIVLAIVSRRVIVSLLAGIYAGALLTTGGDVAAAVGEMLETHLWKTLIDEGKLRVFSFTLLMGAMVGVINRSGGMRGLIHVMARYAQSRRGGQLVTWVLGLLIFFDDYANTMLLGNTLRPLFDKLRISREKLAYLVDSTAAPVAGLALVSTWIAVELDYIRDGIQNLPAPTGWNPFDLFVASIPYRFYVLMALLFVPLVVWLRRDLGPMVRAERRCLAGELPAYYEIRDVDQPPHGEPLATDRWYNAVIPILVTLAVVLVLILQTGRASLAQHDPQLQPRVRDLFGAADSSFALQYGALAGLCTAAVFALGQRLLTSDQVLAAAGQGARLVLPAVMILLCASTISRMTGNKSPDNQPSTVPFEFQASRLYTGEYLQSVLVEDPGGDATPKPRFSYRWLPTIVFLMASIVAFCTGTSFGTMGILMPMVVTLSYAMLSVGDALVSPRDPILLSSIGGVLAGAVFGDHCSPISDTTVLSSQSSGCDHIAHVWTQMPYAAAVAGVSVVAGTLPIGWGVPLWLLLPLQLLLLVGILLVFGEQPEQQE